MVNTVKVGAVSPNDGNDSENLKPKGSRGRGHQLCIQDLLKTLDVDGDGDIDEDDKKVRRAW